jgi:hypothetical protein
MDAWRRVIRPASESNARTVRRVPAQSDRQTVSRLRGPNKRLADALDQLLAGVPLNWGQVEDDPELLTLARLQVAGQECRLQHVTATTADERATLLQRLSPTLDKIKRVPAPQAEKVVPKTLAGFSEKVQVLTQPEEDVPVNTNILALIVRVVAIAAVAGLAIWGVFSLLAATAAPTFSWIELKNGDTVVNRIDRSGVWQSYPCKVRREAELVFTEYYQGFTSKRDAGDALDFIIPTLPSLVTNPPTYTLSLNLMSIAPCEVGKIVDADPGAILKLDYGVQHTIVATNAQPSTPGSGAGVGMVAGPMAVYVAKVQPTPLDVSVGTWHEVRVSPANGRGTFHGVFWHGTPYYDRAGVRWAGDVDVLMVERGDMLYTLIGAPTDGITEEFLLSVVRNSNWQ